MTRTLMALSLFALVACENTTTPPTKDLVAPAAEAGPSPMKELAKMDNRTPVPLQPMMAWHQKQNMMEHLVAIQRITEALSNDDWEGVAAASKLIESSPQMQKMCEHMGAGADGFTDRALAFHSSADTIAPAAAAHDTKAVLKATSKTLTACTSCHATYRQDVVDSKTFTERTGSEHDPSKMHGK